MKFATGNWRLVHLGTVHIHAADVRLTVLTVDSLKGKAYCIEEWRSSNNRQKVLTPMPFVLACPIKMNIK